MRPVENNLVDVKNEIFEYFCKKLSVEFISPVTCHYVLKKTPFFQKMFLFLEQKHGA
jgi:hypothetical protein